MSTRKLSRQTESSAWILNRLTTDRRVIIEVLNEQSLPITEWHLAALLTAEGWRDQSTTQARITLRHIDLPKLADRGYITWDESAATVTDVDRSTVDTMEEAADPVDTKDALEETLCLTLELVETFNGPQHERDIAYGVAAISESADPDPETVEEMAIQLRHCSLPKLDRAGLIEYDPDEAVVAAADCSE